MSLVSHHFVQRVNHAQLNQQQHLHAKQKDLPSSSIRTPTVPSSVSQSSYDIQALAQAARLGSVGWENESDAEVVLRQFDMDLRYGPATGLSRAARWQRAQALGLQPPAYIADILRSFGWMKENSSNADVDMQNGGVRSELPDSKPVAVRGATSHARWHMETTAGP